MGKVIVDEEMRFDVIINGDQAQKELFDLEKATRELTATNKNLKAEKDKLIATGKKETEEYKQITAAMKANNISIKANKDKMAGLRSEIGLTSLTMKQLKDEATMLRLKLYNMTPGSAEYIKLQADLRAVSARIKELGMNSRVAQSSINGLAAGFNRYFFMAASFIATGTGIVLSIQKMIDYNSKLSDSQADVRKTTGLTKDEVDELTKSLGLMKTRTARVELLKIAEQAGRLGITGVKNLKDFVASANEIKVALGDDLSEEAIQEIGKLTNIYKVGEQVGKDFAGAMTAVGSAINEVSASGANQAGYLVDYLKRQSGIAAQAKISADQNIGYAATFDEIGQSVEVSATAMNKVWMDLFKDTATYAKIAGMSVQDFSGLLETDANEAMLRFLEGLNGNNEGLSVMVEKLEDIDVGGARGAQALSALAGSTDLLRKRQDLANEALLEATSVTEEYNIKNENLAATLEKVKKQMLGWFTSESIITGLDNFITWFAKFIGATEDAEGGVTKFRNTLIFLLKAILAIIVGILSYNVAIKISAFLTSRAAQATNLYNLAQKASLVTSRVLRAAQLLLSAAYFLLTGNINRATAAMRLFSITTKLSPWGLLAATIAAVATAYFLYSKNVSGAAKAQKDLNEIRNEVAKSVAQEKVQLEALLKIAKDEEESKEKRLRAIKKLNEISPEYLNNITLENINTEETTKSINKYITALEKKALAQAVQGRQQEAINDLVDKNLKAEEEYQKRLDQAEETAERRRQGYSSYSMGLNAPTFDVAGEKENLENNAKELYDAALEINKTEYEEYNKKLATVLGDSVSMTDVLAGLDDPITPTTPTPPSPTPTSPDKKIDNAKKLADELLKIQQENALMRASLITDSFNREMAIEEENHQVKLQQLRSQMATEAELKAADPQTRAILINKNKALNDQLELEELNHQHRLGTIIQKGLEEDFKVAQEQYEREKTQRETAHNNELAALGNDEQAKKALQDKFNKEETDREAKHLQDLIAKMKAIMDGGDFQGFELELLSEDQKQALLDFLDEANLKLSDLLNKASGSGKSLEGSSIAGDVDILGFSIDQWETTFANLDTAEQKIAAAEMAIGAMMNAWSMYSNFVAAKQQVELKQFERAQDKKQDTLERSLNAGFINQRQYNKAIEELEKETQRKRAEMEYKTAKRNKEMAIANIMMNTALGVAKTLGETGFFGIPLAAIVGALGAVQLGIALATPLPAKGYEDGLYPVQREQDGKMFNARNGGKMRSGLVKKPTILVAEKDPEMIIDGGAWKQMDPGVKDSLYRELGRMGRVPGYEAGFYNSQPAVSGSDVQPENPYFPLFTAALNRNSAVMERLERDGLRATMARNMENARQIKESIKDYDKLRNANKR